jgi:hypothetical protein
MDFYIQMGHGMQKICRDLSAEWNGATVIISPKNIKQDKLAAFSNNIHVARGAVLFDPQLYTPRKHHKDISQYDYWPRTGVTQLENGDCELLIGRLADLNAHIGAEAFIVPSPLTNTPGDIWNRYQTVVARAARKKSSVPLLHTVALTHSVLDSDTSVEQIIHFVKTWDVEGIYLVCEHPERYYLVDKPLWLANILALVAGIKRLGRKVVVGYASHQQLCLSLAKCDAIASGNFLNVRWFQPEHFETIENDEISRRAKWYYCPQTLSEYKISFLDVAKEVDKLSWLKPPSGMINKFSDMLFSGALPSSTNYTETDSHCHYLYSLRSQCHMATKSSYQETKDYHRVLLETAENMLKGLRNDGIRGQDRDFGELIDVNRAAVSVFDKNYGFVMSREWDL